MAEIPRVASVDVTRAPHYSWGEACDGWHLLAGDDLSVIQEAMPPGTSEVRHRHRCARQFFYVLEGEAVLEVEGASHRLRPGVARPARKRPPDAQRSRYRAAIPRRVGAEEPR